MEIKDYFAMVRRWAWLLVVGLILGAIIGVLISIFQSPVYSASTRILVMRAPQEKTTDYTYLSDQQLVQTYVQLLTTRPVLEGASTRLGAMVSSQDIAVQQIRDTQAIQLTVEDGNPQRAADIANVLVQVLIVQNEIIQASRYTLTEQSTQAQITQIQSQIAQMGNEIDNVSAETLQEQQRQIEAQIAALQTESVQLQVQIQQLSTATSVGEQSQLAEKKARLAQVESVLALYQQTYTDLVVLGKPVDTGDTTSHLAQMQTTLQLYQQIYLNLLDNLEAIHLARLQNTPNVVQIEAAIVPLNPIKPRPVINLALAATLGLLLAGGIAFLIDYIDDTIRTPDDIERILKLPVIGYIGDMSEGQGKMENIHVAHLPRSPISEAFRSLRTNLEFTNVDKTLNTILITSSGPSEGKTTIATNLAAIIAQGGKSVLLIDADMRRPRIHSIFGISNRVGLSSMFRSNTPLRSVMRSIEGLEGVYVVTSGSIPPNPTELLASAKMDFILQEARQEVDIVIVDSPPSLVADFQVLATKMDGVLIVVQPGYTHADGAFATLEQLRRVNAKPLGVVLNRIPRDSYYYGGYNHYYYPNKHGAYYYAHDESQPQIQEQTVQLLSSSGKLSSQYSPENYQDDRYSIESQEQEPIHKQQVYDIPHNEITQPRPQRVVEKNKSTEETERVIPTIEMPQPLIYTLYDEDDDDTEYIIRK